MILDGYVDKAELANQLKVCERTLDRWHNQRKGPPRTKVGSKVIYKVEAVREWLDAQQHRKAT